MGTLSIQLLAPGYYGDLVSMQLIIAMDTLLLNKYISTPDCYGNLVPLGYCCYGHLVARLPTSGGILG